MSASPRVPPPRSLNIYRLVVARGLKQLEVAHSFGVSAARISQVVRRVRNWVDDAIGDWLFPGRDDLRFYVALQSEQIRVHELENDPDFVEITSPSWTYSRRISSRQRGTHEVGRSAVRLENSGPTSTPTIPAPTDVNLSAAPINSPAASNSDSLAASSTGQTDYESSLIPDLALCLAQYLIVWKKSRSLTSAFKQPSSFYNNGRQTS